MPIIKSAKKRVRQAKKRSLRNKILTSELKKTIKNLISAVQKKNKEKSLEFFKIAQRNIIKCSKNGIFHKKNASKKISRLNSMIKSLK